MELLPPPRLVVEGVTAAAPRICTLRRATDDLRETSVGRDLFLSLSLSLFLKKEKKIFQSCRPIFSSVPGWLIVRVVAACCATCLRGGVKSVQVSPVSPASSVQVGTFHTRFFRFWGARGGLRILPLSGTVSSNTTWQFVFVCSIWCFFLSFFSFFAR